VSEKVIVKQNSRYQVAVQATDESGEGAYHAVEAVYELTPFGMLLVSLATCTTILLHSYAQNRDIPLEEVEVHLRFLDENIEGKPVEDVIHETVSLHGEGLSNAQRERLHRISSQCSIHRLLEKGLTIHAEHT